jgi:hypothetical protein
VREAFCVRHDTIPDGRGHHSKSWCADATSRPRGDLNNDPGSLMPRMWVRVRALGTGSPLGLGEQVLGRWLSGEVFGDDEWRSPFARVLGCCSRCR